MDIIIPAAGFSTRFPNMRPKYLLADYLSRRMIELAALPYLDEHQIHVVILKQHEIKHHVTRQFNEIFGNKVNVIILESPTSGPAETIYQALVKLNLDQSSPFMVHDCDSVFEHDVVEPGNFIHTASLNDYPTIRTPANKSYVEINDQGTVVSIIEKKIISEFFCVGGYQFAKASDYISAYNSLKGSYIDEIFISSVIDNLISRGEVFSIVPTSTYVDLGTSEDWEKFNNKPTIFCDIDGTIIENQAPYGTNYYGAPPVVLGKNVAALKAMLDRGCQIIFTTSRHMRWESQTRKMLNDLGFNDCSLIMNLHHARRILINDYAPTNPYPSAIAVNIKRDDDSLDQILSRY